MLSLCLRGYATGPGLGGPALGGQGLAQASFSRVPLHFRVAVEGTRASSVTGGGEGSVGGDYDNDYAHLLPSYSVNLATAAVIGVEANDNNQNHSNQPHHLSSTTGMSASATVGLRPDSSSPTAHSLVQALLQASAIDLLSGRIAPRPHTTGSEIGSRTGLGPGLGLGPGQGSGLRSGVESGSSIGSSLGSGSGTGVGSVSGGGGGGGGGGGLVGTHYACE